jgi:hypothetical protein
MDGGFPLFAEQMFMGLGNQWAGTILAFLAAELTPIPEATDTKESVGVR